MCYLSKPFEVEESERMRYEPICHLRASILADALFREVNRLEPV